MKTYDKHEIKKGRIYYYVHWPDWHILPSIIRTKCNYIKSQDRYGGPHASFYKTAILEPYEIRREIFYSFKRAKEVTIKKIKIRQKEFEKGIDKLKNLTRIGLIRNEN